MVPVVVRTVAAGVLLAVVLAGSVVIGAINTVAKETWPEW